MAELLTDEEVGIALERLQGWERRGKALARLVRVPADSYPALRQAIMNEADAMNHHPDMEQTGEGAQITLWTHSAGGITAKDVTLAARIDQVISGAARDRAGG